MQMVLAYILSQIVSNSIDGKLSFSNSISASSYSGAEMRFIPFHVAVEVFEAEDHVARYTVFIWNLSFFNVVLVFFLRIR